MIIGNFIYDPAKDTYRGTITTLTAGRNEVVIRPSRKTGARDPDYRIEHTTAEGSVELGAAWNRTAEKTGPFLSIVLDDPVLPASIHAALFHEPHPSEASRLVWTRPTNRPRAPEPELPMTPAPQPQPPQQPARRTRQARRQDHG
jgi:uncharacterized protein (DUF736 family)